jgi:RNA polymerase sigma factor (sigma-70 family)
MEASALPREGRVFLPRSRRLLGAFSDDRLVEQVRRGNDLAFEIVYDRHHRGILSFCRHMLGTREEAEDAVQHTFISAYNDMLASRRELKLKAWLYTIARNRCLSVLRARREHAVEEVEVSTAGLADQVQERQDLRELLSDMRDLPHEQRAALVLSELGDLSHADIGAVLRVEPVKVKSLVFQARSALIENREARAIPCQEIRQQLSTLHGGALRRGPLRKHIRSCDGCSAFRDEVRRQRTAMAAVLPVVPTLGLKSSALAAIGGGGTAATVGGAAAGSGGSAGGGIFSALGSAGLATKAAVTIAVGGAAIGGLAAGAPDQWSTPASVEQGTSNRAAVADDHASGPIGVADVLPGLGADSTGGLALGVRAYGSPVTAHHSNPIAVGNNKGPTAHGHSTSGHAYAHGHVNANHGKRESKGSRGSNAGHSAQGNTQTGGKSPNAGSGNRTGQQSHSTASNGNPSPTTSSTPPLPAVPVVHGNSDSVSAPKASKTPNGNGNSGVTTPLP